MAQTAPTPRSGSPIRLVKTHRAGRGRAALEPAPAPVAARTRVVAGNPAWARTQRRLGRAATWTLPGYAALLVGLGLVKVPDPDIDFGGYAKYVTTDGYRYLTIGTVAGSWLGLIGIIAVTGLLTGTRARYTAIAALLVGLTGTVVALPLVGLRGLGEPIVGRAYQRGDQAGAVALYADLHDTTAARAALAAVVLGGLGWLLLGIATLQARVLNRADGYLLMFAAVLLGAARYLPILHAAGALLFLAAALGIALTANRLVPRNTPQ